MKFTKFFHLLGVLSISAGCTSLTSTTLPDKPITDDFRAQSIRWESGRSIYFSTYAWNEDGFVGLCGAYAQEKGNLEDDRFDEWLISTARVDLGDELLVNGLGFFNRVQFVKNKAPQGTAACIQTSTKWSPELADAVPDVNTTRSKFTIYD